MALMLNVHQIIAALAKAKHPAAHMYWDQVAGIMHTAALNLVEIEPRVHCPTAQNNDALTPETLSWATIEDPEIYLGFHAVDEKLYEKPVPDILDGLDDEGWAK